MASARVAADAQAIAQLDQQLAADQQAIAQHLHVVQSQAIESYIDSGADSSSSDAGLFAGGSSRAQAASEYASLAVGNITTDWTSCTLGPARPAAPAGGRSRHARPRTGPTRRNGRPRWPRPTPPPPRSRPQQAQVTGQLATAVAAQQAAQAQAAAAAVARALEGRDPAGATDPGAGAATTATVPPVGRRRVALRADAPRRADARSGSAIPTRT